MPNDIGKAFDSLPGWVIPVSVGGVVLVALFSKSGGGRSGTGVNTVVYGPQPTDPGIIALSEGETAAKASVIQTAINAFVSRDITGIEANRDFNLANINASVENSRTQAAEGLGIVQSNNQLAAINAEAKAAADINRTSVAGATSQAHIAAKSNLGAQLFDFGKSVLSVIGL